MEYLLSFNDSKGGLRLQQSLQSSYLLCPFTIGLSSSGSLLYIFTYFHFHFCPPQVLFCILSHFLTSTSVSLTLALLQNSAFQPSKGRLLKIHPVGWSSPLDSLFFSSPFQRMIFRLASSLKEKMKPPAFTRIGSRVVLGLLDTRWPMMPVCAF